MRITLLEILITAMAVMPALASDLTFTLDSNSGSGYVPNIAPDANPPCLPPACVPFTGTLLDNDPNDGSVISIENIGVTFITTPAAGGLTLDNTFFDEVPGAMSGDPDFASDGNPPNQYVGTIFGIDIAPATSVGDYSGTITIYAAGGDGDPGFNGFTVTQQITVDVLAPEPATWSFAIAGLAVLGACFGLRRKWRFSAASR